MTKSTRDRTIKTRKSTSASPAVDRLRRRVEMRRARNARKRRRIFRRGLKLFARSSRNLAGEFLSFIGALAAFVLAILWIFSYQRDHIFDLLRYQTEAIVSDLIPGYETDLSQFQIQADPTAKNWVRIENIVLENPETGDRISVGEMRLLINPLDFIWEDTALAGLTLEDVDLDLVAKGRRPEEIIASIFSATRFLGTEMVLQSDAVVRLRDVDLAITQRDGTVTNIFSDGRGVYTYSAENAAGLHDYRLSINARPDEDSPIGYRFYSSAVGDQIVTRIGVDRRTGSGLIVNVESELTYARDLTAGEMSMARFRDALLDIDGKVTFANDRASLVAEIGFDAAEMAVNLEPLVAQSGNVKVYAAGQLGLRRPAPVMLDIRRLEYPGEGADAVMSGRVEGLFSLAPRALDLDLVALDYEGFNIAALAAGRIDLEDSVVTNLRAGIPAVSVTALRRLWPHSLAPGAFNWIDANVESGRFNNLDVILSQNPGEGLAFDFGGDYHSAKIRLVNFLDPVTRARGSVNVDNDVIAVGLDTGVITTPFGDVDLAELVFAARADETRTYIADISGRAAGAFPAIVDALDNEPLNLGARLQLTTAHMEALDGEGRLQFTAGFPLVDGLGLDRIDYDIDGVFTDVANFPVTTIGTANSDEITLSVTPDGLDLEGAVDIVDSRFDVHLSNTLAPGDPVIVEAAGEVGVETIENTGAALPDFVSMAPLPAEFRAEVGDSGTHMEATFDLTPLGYDLPVGTLSKRAGTRGRADIAVDVAGGAIDISKLSLDIPGFTGDVDVGFEGTSLARIGIGALNLGGVYRGAVRYDTGGAGGMPAVSLSGGRIVLDDIMALGESLGGGSGMGGENLLIRADNLDLIVDDTLALTDISGEVMMTDALTGGVRARINGGTSVNARLGMAAAGDQRAIISIADAGRALKDAGLYRDITGGALSLRISGLMGDGPISGTFRLNDFALDPSSNSTQILKAASLTDWVNPNRPLTFKAGGGDFIYNHGRLDIADGFVFGPAIGVSASGRINTNTMEAALSGVISPAFAVNGAFQGNPDEKTMFGDIGEGIFGVNWSLERDMRETRVTINPLSLLAPGRLRELFR